MLLLCWLMLTLNLIKGMESHKAWLTWWLYALMLLIHLKHRLTVWDWFTKAGKGLDSSQLLDKRSPNGSGPFACICRVTVMQDDCNNSGRMLLLAPLFLIVPLTRKLKLLLGFTTRCYSKGNMQSLQEQHITPSEIVKLIYVLYKGNYPLWRGICF